MASLVVTEKAEIADGIVRFDLRAAGGLALEPFTAGANVSVQAPNGMVRRYSLTNDPAETDRYVIAVKRDPNGRGGSVAMADTVEAGDTLKVSRPRNEFPLDPKARDVLLIAGGIGITPMMSMMRHLTATGAAKFKLVYLTRSVAQTAFREQLMAPEFRPHVTLHHDGGDPANALDLWPHLEYPRGRHVYCCGPRPLMDAVRDMTGHWPKPAVHFESFVDGAAVPAKSANTAFRVRLARAGTTVAVGADETILEALRRDGFEAPSSCESGSCGTCRTTLVAGEADHRDFVLDDSERRTNIMLCVSRARSDELVIDL